MQVELKAVGNGVVVHARGEPAGAGQFIAIQPGSAGEFTEFIGRSLRVPAASAADGKAQLGETRIEPALERSHNGGGDAGRVPIHPHHAAQSLKPERIAQACEELRWPIEQNNLFGDGSSKQRHALSQPWRNMPAMEREIGRARALHFFILAEIDDVDGL